MEDGILYNEDCLETFQRLQENTVDLILTDPPYEKEDLRPYIEQMKRVLKPTGSVYIFGDKNMIANHWYQQFDFPYKDLLFWYYKNSPKPKGGRWRLACQGIMYGFFQKDSTWNEDEARVPYQESTKKLHGRMRPSKGRLKEAKPYDTSKGALPRDIIECPALLGHLAKERIGHRDQKPLKLIRKIILTSSNEGDLVMDPFSGSGTTFVVCKELNRRFIGSEIESHWCSESIKRASNVQN